MQIVKFQMKFSARGLFFILYPYEPAHPACKTGSAIALAVYNTELHSFG